MEFDLTYLETDTGETVWIPPTPNKIAKSIVRRAATYTVSGVIVSLIHQNTTTYNTRQKVQLYVGAYILGAMVADKAADYVIEQYNDTIDGVVDWLWIPVEIDLSAPADETEPAEDPTEQ
jgi:hypothetical protein